MSKPDDDSPRFVRVPLPQNPTEADIDAFVEAVHRLARESKQTRAPEAPEGAVPDDDDNE
jgi:hypothetical protein